MLQQDPSLGFYPDNMDFFGIRSPTAVFLGSISPDGI
jgi:hypothetical protein